MRASQVAAWLGKRGSHGEPPGHVARVPASRAKTECAWIMLQFVNCKSKIRARAHLAIPKGIQPKVNPVFFFTIFSKQSCKGAVCYIKTRKGLDMTCLERIRSCPPPWNV